MLDSGCTQLMTGDPMMFFSLDDNIVGYSDIIFGDNSRGKVKGVGRITISNDHSLSKVLLVDSLKFNHCWSSQNFTLNRQGLGYIPKKGKKAFYETKTVFVKKDGRPYCEKCKKMGHNEKNCTNNKAVSFDSSYVLMKDSKGCVSAKYVGLPIYGAKKNAIWVPKTLVTNIQGPKKIWVPKRVTSLL